MNRLSLPRLARASLLIGMLGTVGAVSAQEQDHRQHHPSATATETPAPSATTQETGGTKSRSMESPSMSQGSQQMQQMHGDMMRNMHQMQMSGDTDRDFAMMMKHHHEQGVKMAEIEAKNGKSPELKAMAHKIIQSQKQEIKKLDNWLNKNKK